MSDFVTRIEKTINVEKASKYNLNNIILRLIDVSFISLKQTNTKLNLISNLITLGHNKNNENKVLTELNYLNLKLWTNISIEPDITLQVIRKSKTNYFTLGYENSELTGLTMDFNSIFIPKAFIESNQIISVWQEEYHSKYTRLGKLF